MGNGKLYGLMFRTNKCVPKGNTPEENIGDEILRYVFLRLDYKSFFFLVNPKILSNPLLFDKYMGVDLTAFRPVTIRIDLEMKNISVLDDNYGQRVLSLDLSGHSFWNERGTNIK